MKISKVKADNYINFSVLMSVYCKEKAEYFLEAVKSVLEQSIKPTEIVIVKDGKLTPSLEETCARLLHDNPQCIRFVQLEKNVGLGMALQKGVLECKCDLIARMDTDDISRWDRFEKQINEFAKNSNLALCGGVIEEFSVSPVKIECLRKVPLEKKSIYKYAKTRNPFNHMTVMFKKKAVLEVGNYQPFYLLEDYYLWYRLIKNGYDVQNLPDVLVTVRSNKKMITRRGGFAYLKSEVKLFREFYNDKYISLMEFLSAICARGIVRICPHEIRSIIYKFILR